MPNVESSFGFRILKPGFGLTFFAQKLVQLEAVLYLFYCYFRKAFQQKQSVNLSFTWLFFLRFDHVKVKLKCSLFFDSHSISALRGFSKILTTGTYQRNNKYYYKMMIIIIIKRSHALTRSLSTNPITTISSEGNYKQVFH